MKRPDFNYYQELQVPYDADNRKIYKQFRRQARKESKRQFKLAPSLQHSDETEATRKKEKTKLQRLVEAFEVLINPRKRSKHDKIPNIRKKVETLNREKQMILEEIFANPDTNFFITGNAGTGKSLLLKSLKRNLERNKTPHAVVAPTGIAALNVSGRTIHSTFGMLTKILSERPFTSNNKGKELSKEIRVLIIDEVSMVRADLFNAVNLVMQNARENDSAFGGVQIIMFGDMAQLSPVLTSREEKEYLKHFENEFFFSAPCVKSGEFEFKYFNLEENFRQSGDINFQDMLNRIREGYTTKEDLHSINSQLRETANEKALTLVSTNNLADKMNSQRLEKLSGEPRKYTAKIKGGFNANSVNAPELLNLKVGARVVLLKNLKNSRLVNGSIGTVEKLHSNSVKVQFDSGELATIEPSTWGFEENPVRQEPDTEENIKNNPIDFEVLKDDGPKIYSSSFTQIPLNLAWAITIHKSQGQTFEKINIDWGTGAFAHGQAYVALSRCSSLDGITLLSPMKRGDIIVNDSVEKFNIDCLAQNSDENFESPLERAVAKELGTMGWTIIPQVKALRYRIDLGVRHPTRPGKFLAGIECDGATYHAGKEKQAADNARQNQLEQIGWNIIRVWSTDWWTSKANQIAEINRQLVELMEKTPSAF